MAVVLEGVFSSADGSDSTDFVGSGTPSSVSSTLEDSEGAAATVAVV